MHASSFFDSQVSRSKASEVINVLLSFLRHVDVFLHKARCHAVLTRLTLGKFPPVRWAHLLTCSSTWDWMLHCQHRRMLGCWDVGSTRLGELGELGELGLALEAQELQQIIFMAFRLVRLVRRFFVLVPCLVLPGKRTTEIALFVFNHTRLGKVLTCGESGVWWRLICFGVFVGRQTVQAAQPSGSRSSPWRTFDTFQDPFLPGRIGFQPQQNCSTSLSPMLYQQLDRRASGPPAGEISRSGELLPC